MLNTEQQYIILTVHYPGNTSQISYVCCFILGEIFCPLEIGTREIF